ncbi:restriction endonuclease subunit S [Treponema sp.]|uniref:restriction endonuclease subunit S n=1 Tax=Treponema sp. TaxID=166 RepID=UPI0025FD0AAE|nr:restriction endonuclease subunit S [Treponema sp.]
MAEWTEYRLGDIVEINPTESIKKGTIAKKIGMDVLQPYCRAIPSFSVEPYSGGSKFKNGDTIMARITPCLENGKTAMVNILNENEIGFGSTEYIVFRAKETITDPYFVYYLVTSDTVRNPAIKSMVGSSGRQRVQTDVVANLSINLPPLETQQKIASLLSSLDDKIELNNRINDNLEQQAQAIFKSWFVDFEPFGGEMPENWRMGKLSEIADYLNGLAMQKFRPDKNEEALPVLKIKELRQGICDDSSEFCSPHKIKPEFIIDDGDIIFSWSGSLLVDIWCGGKCGLNQHLFKVTSKIYDKWFYYLWTKHHLDSLKA